MTARRLRIGLMSFAHVHAAAYATLLAGRADVELMTSDPGGAESGDGDPRGREFAERMSLDYVDDHGALFDWRPDAVIVAAETSRHRDLVERAAAAGAHVLCEKPLATSLADATAMNEACEQAGVNLMVAYPTRFSPAVTRLREHVASGSLGTLMAATGTNNGKLPVERAWFTDAALSGGGALVDHVVHVADLIDSITGFSPVRVHAVTNRILHSGRPGVDVETAGLVTVTYHDGFIASTDCSWSQPGSAPTWGGLTLDLIGDRGSVAIAPFSQGVTGRSEVQGNAVHLPYGVDPDERMLDYFLGCIRSGEHPQPDGRTGLRSLSIMLAAQQSAATGQVVEIDALTG